MKSNKGWQPIETAPRDGTTVLIATGRAVQGFNGSMAVRWHIWADSHAKDTAGDIFGRCLRITGMIANRLW